MVRYHATNGNVRVQFTAEEEEARDAEEKVWSDKSAERKLNQIKEIVELLDAVCVSNKIIAPLVIAAGKAVIAVKD